jgi:hypothetical protein
MGCMLVLSLERPSLPLSTCSAGPLSHLCVRACARAHPLQVAALDLRAACPPWAPCHWARAPPTQMHLGTLPRCPGKQIGLSLRYSDVNDVSSFSLETRPDFHSGKSHRSLTAGLLMGPSSGSRLRSSCWNLRGKVKGVVAWQCPPTSAPVLGMASHRALELALKTHWVALTTSFCQALHYCWRYTMHLCPRGSPQPSGPAPWVLVPFSDLGVVGPHRPVSCKEDT